MARAGMIVCFAGLAAAPLTPAAAQSLLWTRQAGTPSYDAASGVAVDGAGDAYITGKTLGNLAGPSAGASDVILVKYDASGTLLWTRQTGTTSDEIGLAVAVDGGGNAFITGWTSGSLGGPNAGGADCFLLKYDASGNPLWSRQIGTPGNDQGIGVAVDGAGHVYITGNTAGSLGGPSAGDLDAFLCKYDASGNLLWTRQAGTSAVEESDAVTVDLSLIHI